MHLQQWGISVAIGILFFFLPQASAQTPPPNDRFQESVLLHGTNVNGSANNTGATLEAGEPRNTEGLGGASLWWKWIAPSNGFAVVSTAGSISTDRFELDTLVAVYTGSALNQLRLVASNDDDEENESYNSRVVFPVSQGVTYSIAVSTWLDLQDEPQRGTVRLQIQYQEKLVRKQAPAWVITDLKGAPMKSQDLAGKVVLLNFWATWCGPCIAEIPDLIELQNQYGAQGLVIVGVSVDNPVGGAAPASLVRSFVNEHRISYAVGMSEPASSIVSDYGGISAIPTTFLIDRENSIRSKTVGARNKAYFESLVRGPLYEGTRLEIVRNGDELKLVWPAPPGLFKVEFTEGTFGPSWKTLNGFVENESGGKSALRLDVQPSTRYYRLRLD